jgi:signal transduction histidine kinase
MAKKIEKKVAERTLELKTANEDLSIEIRQRVRAEEDLKRAKESAEIANRAKSEFLANMSHELRTPLNHIIGFTELVVDKQFGGLNATQEEYLNDVLSSSAHLLSLINDILDLSKVEAGKLTLELKEISPRNLLEGSLVMVQEKAMKHGIRISKNFDGVPETIQADERKLKQILYNLLSNAVKFTPDGGEISLSAERLSYQDGRWFSREGRPAVLPPDVDTTLRSGGAIRISLQDTGIGIGRSDLERIFKPFEQVQNASSRFFQGTGLGLSLSRKMVELQGGKIWAESDGKGKGSKFIFVIPHNRGNIPSENG